MNQAAPNPLLLTDGPPPFDAVRAEHVVPGIQKLLQDARGRIQAIKDLDGARTWDNTLGALDEAMEPLENAFHLVSHLDGVAHEEKLAEAFAEITPEVMSFFASVSMDAALYQVVRHYSETDEARALDPVRARFLHKTLEEFQREGAELPDDVKARFTELTGQLAQATQTFGQNVLKATGAWSLHITDEAKLAGLPDTERAMVRGAARAAEKDGWMINLQIPIVAGVLRYADDAELRETVWRAYNRRGAEAPYDNTSLIREIIALRAERAQLLGHNDFADYILADRMAGSGARASAFIQELEDQARPAFERERQELAAFRKQLEGTDTLAPWDLNYYAEKMRRALYDYDEEALRAYFPVDGVLSGLFELVGRLYGVEVAEIDGLPTWHEDVRTFELRDQGEVLGTFYVDLFPRPTKGSGAWMSPFRAGRRGRRGNAPHVGGIAGNLTPPTEGRPALLSHREVETVFHEFGHLLHHLFSQVDVRSLGGTNVAWDFVELPSQIMENWAWRREALDLFGRHWQTGEVIPEELFSAMTRARRYRKASHMIRQLGFARMDMSFHTQFDPSSDEDVVRYAQRVSAPYQAATVPDDHSMITAFSHLFSSPTGYAAAYYSYLWASVLDADAFTRFEQEGIFSADVGAAFRDAILATGASAEPAELYQRFMQREPDVSALLRREGLLDDGAEASASHTSA